MTESDGVATKITCSQAQEDALALLGGELNDSEERQLHYHLAHCDQCRKQVRLDRAVWHMLAACPAPMAAPNFNEMLFARIDSEEMKKPEIISSERSEIPSKSPESQEPEALHRVRRK